MAELTANALIEPNGPLETRLFPGETSVALGARITGYLAQAYADDGIAAISDESKRNKAAKAFALYTAYMAVYRRMLSEPLTVNVSEKGGHGYSTKQIDAMKALADEQKAIVDDLTTVVEPADPPRIPPTTARIRLSF